MLSLSMLLATTTNDVPFEVKGKEEENDIYVRLIYKRLFKILKKIKIRL